MGQPHADDGLQTIHIVGVRRWRTSAASGAVLDLVIPPGSLGRELTEAEVRQWSGGLATYRVERLSSSVMGGAAMTCEELGDAEVTSDAREWPGRETERDPGSDPGRRCMEVADE